MLQVGGTAWWFHLPHWQVLGAPPGLSSLPLGCLSAPISPTCATGEGYHVPDLPTSCGHPALPPCTFPLPMPASGLLLPWLLAEPVGR